MLFVVCFLIPGCSGDKLEGTYKIDSVSMTVGGVTTTYNIGDEYQGETLSADMMTITLNEDGTLTTTTVMGSQTYTQTGTWAKNGEKVDITVENQTFSCDCDGETFTMSNEYAGMSQTMTFKK